MLDTTRLCLCSASLACHDSIKHCGLSLTKTNEQNCKKIKPLLVNNLESVKCEYYTGTEAEVVTHKWIAAPQSLVHVAVSIYTSQTVRRDNCPQSLLSDCQPATSFAVGMCPRAARIASVLSKLNRILFI